MFLYEWFFHYVFIKWFGSLVTEIVHTSSISVSDLENQVSRMEWALSLGSLEPNLAGQMINQVSQLLHSPPTLLAPLAQRYDLAHWYGHERGSSNNNDASRWVIKPKYFSPTCEVRNDLLSCFSVFCFHWGKQFRVLNLNWYLSLQIAKSSGWHWLTAEFFNQDHKSDLPFFGSGCDQSECQ